MTCERARALAELASRFEPNANTLDTLGWVQLQRGDAKAAVAAFERALAADPQAESIRERLALASSALQNSSAISAR